jgi:hypothetical protein
MQAQRWRQILIGDTETVDSLRRVPLPADDDGTYEQMLALDLPRTFPTDDWFEPHWGALNRVLTAYASTNPGMGYAQGMAFPVFVLYRLYFLDNPKHATVDTYYSFHKLIHVVRPIYPLNSNDPSPTFFTRHVNALIPLIVSRFDLPLAQKLKDYPTIVFVFTLQALPPLFSNKFCYDEATLVFDFLVDTSSFTMFQRALCVLSAILITFKPVFMHIEYEKILEIITIKEYYDVRRILRIAGILDSRLPIM